MKPIFISYEKWECHKNGMYETKKKNVSECCKCILSDKNLFDEMLKTTIEYPNSTTFYFTNKMFNPISWLGQATCNRICDATVGDVVDGWLSMSIEKRHLANAIAKEVVFEWRKNNENL